jgi:carboxypeptidase C (cathepsin A)
MSGTVANTVVSRRTVGSWTKYANLLFIDQPAGVGECRAMVFLPLTPRPMLCVAGFSYSTNTNDYALNSDTRSAHDNKVFLDVFFKLLPQYAMNKWYLSGESYGGVYVPMLANLVALDPVLTSNFTGIIIGNPVFRCTDNEIGTSFEIVNFVRV